MLLKTKKFLTAEWANLIVVNYQINPEALHPYLPRGTELDFFEGQAFVSLIAFCFNRTKLFGIIPSLPYNFEEVNLRFYVKRSVHGEVRRGVVFIKELVPSKLIATTARVLYNEAYTALPMQHLTSESFHSYTWRQGQKTYTIAAELESELLPLKEKSIEEFILEHYWGYTSQKDGSTIEYQVQHPRWKYWQIKDLQVSPNIKNFYGSTFEETLGQAPHSAFMAQGSSVSVSIPSKFSPD